MSPAFLLLFGAAAAGAQTLSVRDYTKLALESSPEVRSAEQTHAAAEAAYRGQLAAQLAPTASFSGSAYPYGHNPNDAYRFTTWRLNRSEMGGSTRVNLNLFNSFKDSLRTRSAALLREAAARSYWAARQDRAFRAIQSFYDYSSKGQLLEVARQNLAAQQEQYRQTLDLYRNGMKSLADLLKSETDLRSSELRLISAEAERKRAQVELNVLIERDGFAQTELSAVLQPGATELPPISADMARAVEQRPELARARRELERARVALRQAMLDALPTLKADASWGHDDPASAGRPNPNYQLGLSLSLPIGFNGWTQGFAVRSARADRRRSEAELAAALREVRRELYGAFINLERAIGAYAIARQKEEIARRSLDLVSAQYRQGSADAIRMNQAQTDFLNAQVERTLALHDIFIDRARYARAAGDPLW